MMSLFRNNAVKQAVFAIKGPNTITGALIEIDFITWR
jgi:hypothetical protein